MFEIYICTAQFLFILFYTRVTFSCFLPLKDLNPSLFLPDLPEPTFPYLFSLWFYIAVRVFSSII